MREFQICLLAGLLAMLTGCAGVVSLHPLALPNDQDAIFDPALVGTWEEVGQQGGQDRCVVARAESGYTVTVYSGPESGGPGSRQVQFSMRLLKVGERRLLDVYTRSPACQNDGCDNYMRPDVHLFFKLRLDKDSAWLSEMDSDWLKEQIKTGGLLRHEVLMEDDDRIVLTASPSELRRHLLPLVADDRSFERETEHRRVK